MPLACGYGVACGAAGLADPCLDLHEHEHLAIARNDVNFSTSRAVTSVKNCVPAGTQDPAGQLFPLFSQRNAMIGVHDGFSEQLECQHQGLLDLPAATDRSIQ